MAMKATGPSSLASEGAEQAKSSDNEVTMKRRTYRNLKARVANQNGALHHHVYVVLLDEAAARSAKLLKANPQRDPAKPCVYVGMTGLKPDQRLRNHKQGVKAAHVVQRHGLRLLPELYECFNPMPFAAAARMEMDLAEDLRKQGYTVAGGY